MVSTSGSLQSAGIIRTAIFTKLKSECLRSVFSVKILISPRSEDGTIEKIRASRPA